MPGLKNKLFVLVPVLIVLAFFLPNLLKGKIPIPADSLLGLYHPFRDQTFDGYNPGKFPTKNPLITDPVLQTYPWRKTAVNYLKNLTPPLWNPYSFSGQPLLANAQSSPFQFLNILLFILPFNIAWAAIVILPTLMAAAFMYLFLRELNLSKAASALGGAVLPLSGFFVAWLTWGTIVTTAAWLPLLLLSIEKIYKRISPLWFLISVFSTSQIIFSGHLQTALYVTSAAILYAIYKFKETKKIKNLLTILFSLGLGLLLSAVQILPTLEFISLSARNIDQGFTPGRKDWFIPIQHLIQFLAPDYFGNPTTYNYWGIWNYAEFVGFVGLMPLTLVTMTILKRGRHVMFFTALLIISLALALENPLSKIPYLFKFPFIQSLQPSRIIVLICFSLSVLAAFGLDQLTATKPKKKYIFVYLIPLVMLFAVALITYLKKGIFPSVPDLDPRYIALRNLAFPILFAAASVFIISTRFIKIPRKILITAIFLVTFIDLFRFAYKFTPFSRLPAIFPTTQTIEFLKSDKEPYRITTLDRRIMHPNIAGAYQIESIDGYDPLYLKSYAQYISVMESNNPNAEVSSFNRILTPQIQSSKLLNLLNVKYMVSFDEINSPDLVKVNQEGITKTYENKKVLPRAFFVENVIPAPNKEEEYATLLRPDFDLSTKATAEGYSYGTQPSFAKAEVSNYSGSTLVINTESARFRPLVVTNINYPGWRAKIDGKETKIFETDAIFQLVEVPQGKHTVEFKFAPQSFYNGLYLSVAGLLLTLGSTVFIWQRKYQS